MIILVYNTAAKYGGAFSILSNFYNFANEFSKKYPEFNIKWIFLVRQKFFPNTKNIQINTNYKIARFFPFRILFEMFGLSFLKKLNPNLIISLQNTTFWNSKIKQILYVHQPIPFQKTYKFTLINPKLFLIQHLLSKLIKKSIKFSDYIIVQSQWLKRFILENNIFSNENRIIVEVPKVNELFLNIKSNNNINTFNTFFYPAHNYVYKNHKLLKNVASRLNKDNVQFKFYLTIKPPIFNKIKNVYYLGNLNIKEMKFYYENSILLFPSLIESFGLPLLEAKSLNRIIFASNTPFSREILLNYDNAYFFEPKEINQLVNLIKKSISKEIEIKSNLNSKEELSFENNSLNLERLILKEYETN